MSIHVPQPLKLRIPELFMSSFQYFVLTKSGVSDLWRILYSKQLTASAVNDL